jgi:hypothetical protein
LINMRAELITRKVKLIDLARQLAKKRNQKICYVSFSKRVNDGKLKLHEVEEIFDIIGCRLIVADKDVDIFLNKEA